MKKWIWIVAISLLIIIIGIVMGYFLFFYSNTSRNEVDYTKKLANSDDRDSYENNSGVIVTSYSGLKLSPNATISFEVCYKECNHVEVKEEIIDESLVNLNEQELQEKYSEWTIKQFLTDEVILSRESEGYCNGHYILKEKDGYIGIYKLNNNGEEELVKLTSVLVQYLPETDMLNIKEGLKVYTKENLNKILEDFE